MRGLLALPFVLTATFAAQGQVPSSTRETVAIAAADVTCAQTPPVVMTFRRLVPSCGHGIATSVVHVLSLQRIPLGPPNAFPKMWITQDPAFDVPTMPLK